LHACRSTLEDPQGAGYKVKTKKFSMGMSSFSLKPSMSSPGRGKVRRTTTLNFGQHAGYGSGCQGDVRVEEHHPWPVGGFIELVKGKGFSGPTGRSGGGPDQAHSGIAGGESTHHVSRSVFRVIVIYQHLTNAGLWKNRLQAPRQGFFLVASRDEYGDLAGALGSAFDVRP
jgi:hypothetical protein